MNSEIHSVSSFALSSWVISLLLHVVLRDSCLINVLLVLAYSFCIGLFHCWYFDCRVYCFAALWCSSDAVGNWILILGGFLLFAIGWYIFEGFLSSCIGTPMPCALSVQVRLYLVISLFEYRFSLLFSRDFSGFYLFAQVEFWK